MPNRTLSLALVGLIVAPAWADIVYVNGACGDDGWTGRSPTCQFPDGPKRTIQAGINGAVNKLDEVIVADGVYTGSGNKNLDFAGRLITLRSASGSENCIIDCEDDGRAFYFHSGETVEATVDGFSLVNGNITFASPGPDGGGGHSLFREQPNDRAMHY